MRTRQDAMDKFSQPIALLSVIACLLSCVPLATHAEQAADLDSGPEPLVVRHYQAQERYRFGLEVLDLALSKLEIPYEIITPPTQMMNEARGERYVIQGKLDLQFLSATAQREASMIPVKIPVYQGILGLRLLLATPERQQALSQLQTVSDLRRFVGGHGADWGDLPVYAANQLPVMTNGSYEALFRQLAVGRFDYFHRGLNEIWDEAERHQDNLLIVHGVALFYPQPVYFFVTKQRPELARKIEEGLKKAHEDGSIRVLFQRQFGAFIKQANLENRRLIVLKNPDASIDSLDGMLWWMPESYRSKVMKGSVAE
jgi:hypothetical protein